MGVSKGVGEHVDAVVGGHTHHIADTDETDSGAPAIETGEFGQSFGHIEVTVDGDNVTATAKVVDVPEMYCKGDPAWDESEPPTSDQLVVNDDICDDYLTALKDADELGKEPVGAIVGGADRATNNGTDLGANRGSEMTAGNLIAQSFYEYSQAMAKPADFGIMNPGGVRAEIDPNNDGKVTKGESFSAQPFGNTYGTVEISGAQIYTMLEQQWKSPCTQTSRDMLALGLSDSISYTYDADGYKTDEDLCAPYENVEGVDPDAANYVKHVKDVYVNNELVPNDTSKKYTVASNAFLLEGADGFQTLKDGENHADTGIIDNDVFNIFLGDNPGYVVDYMQRGVAISGDEEIAAGEVAKLDLGSLSMTYQGNKQPLPESVQVALVPTDEAPLETQEYPEVTEWASVELDNTVTPNLNETGQASIELTVPDDYGQSDAGELARAAVSDDEDYAMVIVAGPTVFQIPGGLVPLAQPEPDPEPTEEPTDGPTTGQPTTGPSDGASDGSSGQPSDGSTTQPGEDLPNTGANVAGFVVVALLLVTAGGVLVARRKTDQV